MSTTNSPWILGLSAAFHNGAACLLRGDQLVVAIQEERLVRVKRAPLPLDGTSLAVRYCLAAAGISPRDVDIVVNCAIGAALKIPDPSRPPLLNAFRTGVEFHTIPHHLGHALSAYMTSGFDDAATLVIDGGGSSGAELTDAERRATLDFLPDAHEHLSIYMCTGGEVTPMEKQLADTSYCAKLYPHMRPFGSLGHMYSSVSEQIFGDYLEAGKVMALASYGTPRFKPSDFFVQDGARLRFKDTVPKQVSLVGRWPNHQNEYYDLSTAVQHALEDALALTVSRVARLTGSRRLCYAGGVALNSVANHRILHHGPFEDIHILAAAEDSGPAIGAAYYGFLRSTTRHRSPKRLSSDFLGQRYSVDSVDATLRSFPGVKIIQVPDLATHVADLLCEGKIVGWYHGESEFGPRSLGHRAILCDARRSDAKKTLNERVKFREAFRPFAPCVMEESLTNWFDVDRPTQPMKYMLQICPFREEIPEHRVPGAMHVDRTGRLQTVTRESNPEIHAVLERFQERTGVPMIINTSLNIMGEPIVETVREALWLLLTTGVDFCVINGRLVGKTLDADSILSLVPYRNCHIKSVEGNFLYVTAMTDHGPYDYYLPAGYAECIDRLDDKTCARDYLRQLPPQLAQDSPLSILTLLHRYSMVRFRNDDPG